MKENFYFRSVWMGLITATPHPTPYTLAKQNYQLSPNINENKRQRLRQQFILNHDNFLKLNIVTVIHELWNQYQLRLRKLLNFPCKSPQPPGLRRERSISPNIHPFDRVWRRWCTTTVQHTMQFCYEILPLVLFQNMMVAIWTRFDRFKIVPWL